MSFSSALDKLKESFLVAAAQGGSSQDCESLLEMGANINWKGAEGDTPLLAACRRGHRDTMQVLIAHGADINIVGTNDNCTPLHICARRGDMEGLNILLECSNVNLSSKDKDGMTALELAKSKGNESVQNRLLQWKKETSDPRQSTSNPALAPVQTTERGISSSSSLSSASDLPVFSRGRSQAELTSPRSSYDPDAKAGPSTLATAATTSTSSSNTGMSNSRKKLEDKGDASYTLISSSINPNASAGALRDSRRGSSGSSSSNSSSVGGTGKSSSATGDADHKSDSDDSSPRFSSTSSSAADSKQPSSKDESSDRQQALKKIIEQEQRLRKSLEVKIEALSEQNLHMNLELQSANHIAADLRSRFDELESRYNRLSGKESVMSHMSLDECNDLERELKAALASVESRKDYIIKNELGKGQEQRLCVVCCVKEKSVVLLPCRHMCLCDECAQNEQISTCPLCRKVIGHRISVFA